jgi:multidrug efflux pump
MLLSDISVKRPVLAATISLLLVVLGVVAFLRLPLREIPNIDPPIVSVETNYRGASAGVIESRITQVVEDAVSGIEGIELIQSSSQNGRSSVSIEFTLAREIESAANDVRDAVGRISSNLPTEADPPQVFKVDGDSDVIIWLNLASKTLDSLALTDYAERYIVDRLSTIDGVARVQVGGGFRYAMRIWLKRAELAARGLTVNDVATALRRENIELPAGRIESAQRDFTVRITRGYRDSDDFKNLVITKRPDGHVVTLAEVADVELGSLERRSYFRGNGQPQVGLGIIKQSTANALDVSRGVRDELKRLTPTLPQGMEMFLAVDTSEFIEAAVHEVYFTLSITMLLVILVIYFFLGSWRAALIPAVTVPVCIVAAFIALYAFGFSLNLLTLLALVLSIGLVVDDAIVVLENCQRRVDLGETPLLAAYRGARQVGFAVIATTAVLVAVFVPIAFMEGNLGRLFRELGAAIAAAVAISAVVALSLSPMMCSKLLRPSSSHRGLAARVDRGMERITLGYRRLLGRSVGRPLLFALALVSTLAFSWLLFRAVPSELAPPEDRGLFFVTVNAPEGAGYDYTVQQMQEVEKRVMKLVDDKIVSRVNTRAPRGGGGGSTSEDMHTGMAIAVMAPWNERTIDTATAMEQLAKSLNEIPGIQGFPQMRQGFGRGFGQPLQFVLLGSSYEELVVWRDQMLKRIAENPKLLRPDSDYKETRPQLRVQIDRARAADLGVSVEEVGTTLETMLGSRRVTTFIREGEEYDVLLQAQRSDRADPSDLTNLFVKSRDGALIPLSNLVTLNELAEPGSFNRFNRLRAITISAALAPGYPLGEAINYLETVAHEELPSGAAYDYKGDSREYQKAGSSTLVTFAFALLVVFLVLAAQFESFVHPFVIMLTVPLAVLGALVGLWLFGQTLNIYSQIGIVMLVGLAAKNGILIVEFANQMRDEGLGVVAAVIEASAVRLRPIVMTSVCTVVGALPLALGHGAGANSRIAIGVVIISGVLFSTLLSLFVVPAFYVLLARFTRSPEAIAKEIRRLEVEEPDKHEEAIAH